MGKAQRALISMRYPLPKEEFRMSCDSRNVRSAEDACSEAENPDRLGRRCSPLAYTWHCVSGEGFMHQRHSL